MPKRSGYSSKRKPFQIYWDDETRVKFEDLIQRVDPLLPRNVAVLKLILDAIAQGALPGYEKKPLTPKIVENKLQSQLSDLADGGKHKKST